MERTFIWRFNNNVREKIVCLIADLYGGRFFMEKSITKRKELIFKIALCAIMAALSIALDKVSVNVVCFKITFYSLPLIVVGITNGPIYGLIAGAASGIVLQLTSPYGITPSTPFWALAPVAWGGISGLANYLLKKRIKNHFICYGISIVIASIIANLINTFAMIMDSLLVKDSYYTMATIMVGWPARLLLMVIQWIPHIIIASAVCEALNKVFGFNEEEDEETPDKVSKLSIANLYLIILNYSVNIFLIINMINEKTKYYSIIIASVNVLIAILSIVFEILYLKKNLNIIEKKKKIFNLILSILIILALIISIFVLIKSMIIVL